MNARITITYEITTPESAERGEFEETGWEDEDGVSFETDEDGTRVEHAVEFLQSNGAYEPSDWPTWSPRCWYSQTEGDINYRTGAEKRRAFHLEGFTEIEQRQIYALVKESR